MVIKIFLIIMYAVNKYTYYMLYVCKDTVKIGKTKHIYC